MSSSSARGRGNRRGFPTLTVVLVVVLALALVAVPVVFLQGYSRGVDTGDRATGQAASPDGSAPTLPGGGSDGTSPDMSAFVENPTGSQVSLHRLSDGYRTGTATERFARPALSLIKLYIADHVLEHGTLAEQYEAIAMISSSDDGAASELHGKYPDSIEETARKYGLMSTRGDERWGYSMTSTYDAVSFISQLMAEDPTSPILVAMAQADPVAADGYGQDFGTSVLPGVIGTKWGWSDDRELHSSVSFGEDFVVAAAVTGSADDLTSLVEAQLTDEVTAADQ